MDDPIPGEFDAAAAAHGSGNLDFAEAAYRRILDARPDHGDATHLLGVLEHQRGRHQIALELIKRAIGLDAGRADYRNNLGVALRALGRLDEAERSVGHVSDETMSVMSAAVPPGLSRLIMSRRWPARIA